MIKNNELKEFKEISENRNGSVFAHGGVQQRLLSMQQGNTAESGSS
jgi:hypothetical protein